MWYVTTTVLIMRHASSWSSSVYLSFPLLHPGSITEWEWTSTLAGDHRRRMRGRTCRKIFEVWRWLMQCSRVRQRSPACVLQWRNAQDLTQIDTSAPTREIIRSETLHCYEKDLQVNGIRVSEKQCVTPDFPKKTKCIPICMSGSSFMHIVT
jgi:hypothetical protein